MKNKVSKDQIDSYMWLSIAVIIVIVVCFKQETLEILKFLFVMNDGKANWVAFGAMGVFISYIVTIKENSKKIDADLKANARIEWIQKVRELTALFISDFYLFIDGKEKDWIDIQKNVELLILYFGQSIDNEEKLMKEIKIIDDTVQISEKAWQILLNIHNNEGKNNYISMYLSVYNDLFEKRDYQNIVNKISRLNKSIDMYNISINEIYSKSELVYCDEYIEELKMSFSFVDDVILSEDDSSRVKKLQERINNLKLKISKEEAKLVEHKNYLLELRKIVSIYLKIEWDIAKEGK